MTEPEKTQPASPAPDAPPATLVLHQEKKFSLAPRNMAEAIDFANYMARSDMVPSDFRGKPANIVVAVQMGAELGIPPVQALANICVINGRATMWGDLVLAVVQGHPQFQDIEEVVTDEGAICTVYRKGRKPVTRGFSKAEAIAAGLWDMRPKVNGRSGGEIRNPSPWHNYPKRMMQMRARAFAIRDSFSDALKGLGIREEVADYALLDEPAGPPGGGTEAGRAAAAAGGVTLGAQPAGAGGVVEAEITPPCPKCKGPTRKKSGGQKKATRGDQGEEIPGEWYPPFWSCCAYPQCRGTAKCEPEEARVFMESVGVPQPPPVDVTFAGDKPPESPAGEQMPLAPAPPPEKKPHQEGDPVTLEWIMMKIRIAETQQEVEAARKLGRQNLHYPEDLKMVENRADTRWHELLKSKARS